LIKVAELPERNPLNKWSGADGMMQSLRSPHFSTASRASKTCVGLSAKKGGHHMFRIGILPFKYDGILINSSHRYKILVCGEQNNGLG